MMPNIAIAAISRLVAIGRRMKISETCISALLTSAALTAAPAATAASATPGTAAAREIRRDARTGFEAQLPFGDDRFAGLQAFLHHHVVGHALARGDRALLDR